MIGKKKKDYNIQRVGHLKNPIIISIIIINFLRQNNFFLLSSPTSLINIGFKTKTIQSTEHRSWLKLFSYDYIYIYIL